MSCSKRFSRIGFLLALAITCSWSCALFQTLRYEKPKVSLESLEVHKLNFLEAELEVNLVINNPNSFPLSISDVSYLARYEKQEIASGSHALIKINEANVGKVSLPLKIKLAKTKGLVQALLGKGKAKLDLEVSGIVGTPIGKFPLSHKKTQEINISSILQKNG